MYQAHNKSMALSQENNKNKLLTFTPNYKGIHANYVLKVFDLSLL